MSLDGVLKAIQRDFEARLTVAVNTELKMEMEKYGRLLEKQIKSEWESYLNSYTPTVYKRTGATSGSIKYSGTQGTAQSGMTATVNYGSQAYDRYTKSYRIPFEAIDKGWSYNPSGTYRYHYYEGSNMTSKIIANVESRLPNYIKLEMN